MLGVDIVHPDDLVANQDGAGSGDGLGQLDGPQHLRTAVGVHSHREHGATTPAGSVFIPIG